MAKKARAAKRPAPKAAEDLGSLILDELEKRGIGLDQVCGDPTNSQVKVVCVSPNLRDSVERLGESARDQVVMVRIDEATRNKLDAWVETGAVKSRSEAAALFIREGLGVRESELAELRGALESVTKAKEQLRERASRVLGTKERPK